MRSASEKRSAPGRHHHELLEVDAVVGVRAAVQDVHHRHGQHARRLAAEVAVERQARLGRGRLGDREATRPGSRSRPGAPCSGVPSSSISARSTAAWSAASIPITALRRSRRSRCATACAHALAAPLARRRRAARPPRTRPVDAPEGTAARPCAPDSSHTSTSTVGLPRESRIWRACTRADRAHSAAAARRSAISGSTRSVARQLDDREQQLADRLVQLRREPWCDVGRLRPRGRCATRSSAAAGSAVRGCGSRCSRLRA